VTGLWIVLGVVALLVVLGIVSYNRFISQMLGSNSNGRTATQPASSSPHRASSSLP